MAEHQISHYIDMFAGDKHPRSSHGEQVGIATITMSHLQNTIINKSTPPLMGTTNIPTESLKNRFGDEMGNNMIEQTQAKALSEAAATSSIKN